MAQSKFRTDVHLTVSIHKRGNGGILPDLAIYSKNQTKIKDTKLYASLYDLSQDYPENTSVYSQAEAVFDVDTFNNNLLEVIPAPATAANTPAKVAVKPTKDGATVSATTTPAIIAGIQNHLHDGFKYLILDGFAEADIETLSDFLYKQQRIMTVAQLTSVDDLGKLKAHAASTMTTANSLDNLAALVDTSNDRFPVAQADAFAVSNIPTDYMHIENLSEFEVDPNLSDDDVDQIESLNGIAIVNKGGDLLPSGSKTLAGNNYIDQFVHFQIVVDTYQQVLQKYLNDNKFPSYTDKTIGEMKTALDNAGNNMFTQGILETKPLVTSIKRADVLPSLVAEREYNGFRVNATIADDIQSINAALDLVI